MGRRALGLLMGAVAGATMVLLFTVASVCEHARLPTEHENVVRQRVFVDNLRDKLRQSSKQAAQLGMLWKSQTIIKLDMYVNIRAAISRMLYEDALGIVKLFGVSALSGSRCA